MVVSELSKTMIIIYCMRTKIFGLIFFATTYGPNTVSALPLLKLLDILTVENFVSFFETYLPMA